LNSNDAVVWIADGLRRTATSLLEISSPISEIVETFRPQRCIY
jgi:hypothetical protein